MLSTFDASMPMSYRYKGAGNAKPCTLQIKKIYGGVCPPRGGAAGCVLQIRAIYGGVCPPRGGAAGCILQMNGARI